MSAESILASRRVAAAARQKVFYDKHRDRILANKREGSRLVRLQREPDAEPAERDYHQYEVAAAADNDDFRHAYPDDPPRAPEPRLGPRVKYDLAAAEAAIRNINETSPDKVRKKATISSYVSGVRRLFKDLAPCTDLWARLSKPKAVINRLQARINAKEAALSSTTTLITVIMVCFDHLPHFNLSDDHKNEFRAAANLYQERNAANNLVLKASADYRVVHWTKYLRLIDEKYPEGSVERLIAQMYREVPVRDDFAELRIVEKAAEMTNDTMNYLLLPRGGATIVLRAYKTEKRFRALRLPHYRLSQKLTEMLRAYVKEHDLPYGAPLFKGALSSKVSKMNKSVGINKLSINALRSMTIASESYDNRNLSEEEQAKRRILLATRMLHNSKTAIVYRRTFDADFI